MQNRNIALALDAEGQAAAGVYEIVRYGVDGFVSLQNIGGQTTPWNNTLQTILGKSEWIDSDNGVRIARFVCLQAISCMFVFLCPIKPKWKKTKNDLTICKNITKTGRESDTKVRITTGLQLFMIFKFAL